LIIVFKFGSFGINEEMASSFPFLDVEPGVGFELKDSMFIQRKPLDKLFHDVVHYLIDNEKNIVSVWSHMMGDWLEQFWICLRQEMKMLPPFPTKNSSHFTCIGCNESRCF